MAKCVLYGTKNREKKYCTHLFFFCTPPTIKHPPRLGCNNFAKYYYQWQIWAKFSQSPPGGEHASLLVVVVFG